jgi:hypothetical protein
MKRYLPDFQKLFSVLKNTGFAFSICPGVKVRARLVKAGQFA